MKFGFAVVAAAVLLAGCGDSGSKGLSAPEALIGTWSDACPRGMITIDADTLHIDFPEKEDFKLTASEFDGKTWKASFENGGKKITDVYVFEDNTLRADQIITESGTFNSNKIRMTKCS
jgi:major membrane immunogen (membrane-anchored lipoprotein)